MSLTEGLIFGAVVLALGVSLTGVYARKHMVRPGGSRWPQVNLLNAANYDTSGRRIVRTLQFGVVAQGAVVALVIFLVSIGAPVAPEVVLRPMFVIAGAGVLIFNGYAIVKCLRSRMPNKGRWALLPLVTVGRVQLLWNTGDLAVLPFIVSLLGVSATLTAEGGWVLGIGLPVGAAITVRRIARFTERASAESVTVHDAKVQERKP